MIRSSSYPAPSGSSGGRIVRRSTGELATALVATVVGALLVAVTLWFVATQLSEGMPPALAFLFVVVSATVLGGGLIGLWRCRSIVVDANGLTLREGGRVHHLSWDQVRGSLEVDVVQSRYEMVPMPFVGLPVAVVAGRRIELGVLARAGATRQQASARAGRQVEAILALDPGPSPLTMTSALASTRPPRLVLEEEDRLRVSSNVAVISSLMVSVVMLGVTVLALVGGVDELGRVFGLIFIGISVVVGLVSLVGLRNMRGPHQTVVDANGLTIHSGPRTTFLSWTEVRGNLRATTVPVRTGEVMVGVASHIHCLNQGRKIGLTGASLLRNTKQEALIAAQDRIELIETYDPLVVSSRQTGHRG